MSTSSTSHTRASDSEQLPETFHQPAPLRSPEQVTGCMERGHLRSQAASLAVMRVIAFGAGVSWLAFMALGGNTSPSYLAALTAPPSSAASLLWWVFTLSSLGAVLASFLHRRWFYQLTLLLGSGSFLVMLLVHLGWLMAEGASPLSGMYPGDYAGLPMAMLMAVLPGRIGLPVAMAAIGLAVTVNLGTPLGWNTILEIAHAQILILPFLALLQTGRQAARSLDRRASRVHADAVQVARLKTLGELETRFLGYVHDRVLTYLDAVRRGVLPSTDDTGKAGGLPPVMPTRSTQLSLAGVIDNLASRVQELAPGIGVSTPGEIPAAATLPADVATMLNDALLEALRNSLAHAPAARRTCRIAVELEGTTCLGITVNLSDDGPGFDPNRIPGHRAGVRVAIIGRMQATEGCDASIDTAPGKGAAITLSWHVQGPGASEPVTGDTAVPTAYELVGVGRVFHPISAAVVLAVFFGLNLNNPPQEPALRLLGLLAAAVAVLALARGKALKLPPRAALVVGLMIPVFFLAAWLEGVPPADHWPALWYPWVFILLCTYLAIRDRAAVAWGVWALCLGLGALITGLGLNPWAPGTMDLIAASALLLPATLIPRLVTMTTRRLPLAMATERSESTARQVVAIQRAFVDDSADWIAEQVRSALAPGFPEEVRRNNAYLLELKLRDSIRSPLFDTVEINRAVWNARARGVRVRLLDDRTSASGGRPQKPTDPRLRQVHQQVATALRADGVTAVTARILPDGRAAFATVLVENSGQIRRVEIPADPHLMV